MNEPMSEPPDIRKEMAIKDAVKRAELWAALGYPVSKPHMPQHEYDHDYRGRIWFVNETVMDQAQQALKIILCPACVKPSRHGFSCTRFYTTIEDDVMTVFPAVGHFLCHHCGFEEYAPLKHDPRQQQARDDAMNASMLRQMSVDEIKKYFELRMRGMTQQMSLPGDYLLRLQQQLGTAPGIGIGGIKSEEEALRRLYNKEMERLGRAVANPPVMSPMLGPKVNKPK